MLKVKRKVDNKMRTMGETDFDKRPIQIKVNKKAAKKFRRRPGYPEVLDTIVHEEQHVKHPGAKEKTVKKMSERLVKKLPRRMKQAYYNLYAK